MHPKTLLKLVLLPRCSLVDRVRRGLVFSLGGAFCYDLLFAGSPADYLPVYTHILL